MSEECISKLRIAERQLETAIGLLASGADYASVVTSAGAADAILMGWVLKAGKGCYVGDSRISLREILESKLPRAASMPAVLSTMNSPHRSPDSFWITFRTSAEPGRSPPYDRPARPGDRSTPWRGIRAAQP